MPDKRFGHFDQLFRKIRGEDTSHEQAAMLGYGGGYNEEYVVLPTGTAYGTDINSDAQYNYSAVGFYLFWNIDGQPSSGTAQLYIEVRNPANLDWTTIYQTGAINATGTITTCNKYLFYPGAVDTGSQLDGVCELPIPRVWRVRSEHVPQQAGWFYSVAVAQVDS